MANKYMLFDASTQRRDLHLCLHTCSYAEIDVGAPIFRQWGIDCNFSILSERIDVFHSWLFHAFSSRFDHGRARGRTPKARSLREMCARPRIWVRKPKPSVLFRGRCIQGVCAGRRQRQNGTTLPSASIKVRLLHHQFGTGVRFPRLGWTTSRNKHTHSNLLCIVPSLADDQELEVADLEPVVCPSSCGRQIAHPTA